MSISSTIEHLPNNKAVITVNGSLTLGTSLKVLDSQIQNLIDGGLRHLVLELSGVDYADSAGLGLLVHAYGRLSEKQGTVTLTGVRPRVLELICMTKVDTFFAFEQRSGGSPLPAES